jgi:uncharacterized protein (TIGR02246 family)
MSHLDENLRPVLQVDDEAVRQATEAVTRFVDELQAGIDDHDADVYNRHFAADVLSGSPFGATVQGYETLHAIHAHLLMEGRGGPSSRYDIDHVVVPTPDVAVAHVRRVALDASPDITGAFSEMALYVLVRRGDSWWLTAGQNTPVRH